jgi:hypothetical protein
MTDLSERDLVQEWMENKKYSREGILAVGRNNKWRKIKQYGVGSGKTLGATVGSVAQCDPGAQVRNPNRESLRKDGEEQINVFGDRSGWIKPSPSIMKWYQRPTLRFMACSWSVFEFCQRAVDHVPLEPAEAVALNAWKDDAFA